MIFPLALNFAFLAFPIYAQDSDMFRKLEIVVALQRPPQYPAVAVNPSVIKDIQLTQEMSGFAVTDTEIFRTDNDGATWNRLSLPTKNVDFISGAAFIDDSTGFVLIGNSRNRSFSLARTTDGGITWSSIRVDVESSDFDDADVANATVESAPDGGFFFKFRHVSSSNFDRYVVYRSDANGEILSRDIVENDKDGESATGRTLRDIYRNRPVIGLSGAQIPADGIVRQLARMRKKGSDASTTWFLSRGGNCEGEKTHCWQATRIFVEQTDSAGTRLADITPPDIAAKSAAEESNAKLAASKSVFAVSPNGNTRVSLERGFDKCTAATVSQMQTWWNSSPFYDVNIYMSGRNRGCSQPQLNSAWVTSVTNQGWRLIPTIVGYQSPCSVCTSCQKHSSDAATAEQQGRGEADIAVTDANNLGLTAGSVLYYDMERYDDLSGTGACSTPTKAFLKGWTDRVKELGFVSGVYGSPTNANNDWINIPQASQPDVVWLARWNNVMSVWGVAPLPDTFWTNHQRIHQWLGPRDETWGGVTFNIDNNISDAPLAAVPVAKNKRADFDGDGKTDVSVWRPDTGVWYAANSSNGSYAIIAFGISTDIMTPGDYDGDGKTDFSVWRPSDGTWHMYSRSIYRSFAFGANGDIPVPADYDGDGRTDAAVFRPSTGVWYIWNSFDSRGTSYTITQFGLSGDRPMPGDYDGDGRSDIAVYRPADGVWYMLRSTAGFGAVQFGFPGDRPVPGDFDGDGKMDQAIYRDGIWYLLMSQQGVFATQFGIATDKPTTGDFDGDGRDDLAVFRPETGVWYVWLSTGGYSISQFGLAGDEPVPSAYTR